MKAICGFVFVIAYVRRLETVPPDARPAICLWPGRQYGSPPRKVAREGQTHRKVGTQSHGPVRVAGLPNDTIRLHVCLRGSRDLIPLKGFGVSFLRKPKAPVSRSAGSGHGCCRRTPEDAAPERWDSRPMNRSLSPQPPQARALGAFEPKSLQVGLSPAPEGTEEQQRQFAAAAPARRPVALDLDRAGPGGDLCVRRWEEELLDRP